MVTLDDVRSFALTLPRTTKAFVRGRVKFRVGRIVQGGCATRPLPDAVIGAYDAPFPDDTFKAGARQFPLLVPTAPDDPAAAPNRAAWEALAPERVFAFTAHAAVYFNDVAYRSGDVLMFAFMNAESLAPQGTPASSRVA